MDGVISHQRVNDFTNEVHNELAFFGLNRSEQLLAIPYVWFTPGGSDPDSAGARAVVMAVQNGLRRAGVATKTTGYVDRATVAALRALGGPNWKQVPWTHLLRRLRAVIVGGNPLHIPAAPEATGMYEAMGDVPLSNIKFNAAGTAMGNNPATTELFRELQRQLNRIAHVKGFGKLKVDGLIGKNTVAAAVAGENAAGQSIVMAHTPEGVARRADVAVDAFRHTANQLGAPARVSGSTSESHAGGGDAAVRVDPTQEGGLTVAPNNALDSVLGSPLGLAAIGVGAFGLFYFLDPGKKKRRKGRR